MSGRAASPATVHLEELRPEEVVDAMFGRASVGTNSRASEEERDSLPPAGDVCLREPTPKELVERLVKPVKTRLPPGEQWTDATFPPSVGTIGAVVPSRADGGGSRRASAGGGAADGWRWARGGGGSLGLESGADGVLQGRLGDCWLVSAFTVVARHRRLLDQIFVSRDTDAASVYCVRLCRDGRWVPVLLDDWLPVADDDNGNLLFARGKPDELWVPLLEKAFAKLYGSYAALEGGWVHDALVDLTGGVSETIEIGGDDAPVRAGLWERLLSYHEAGHLLGAGSPPGDDADTSPGGIVQGHAYALLQLRNVEGHRLLQLSNPWGGALPVAAVGAWSPWWTPRLTQKLDNAADAGTSFWLTYDRFVDEFDDVYICRLFGGGWLETKANGVWRGATAAGCMSYDGAEANPQFHLRVTESTACFITLTQRDARGTGALLHHIHVMVAYKGGLRCRRVLRSERVCSSGQYINLRQVSCEATLERRAEPYTIFVSTYAPGEEASFVLAVYSDRPVGLAPIDPEAVGVDG
jgi:hypothetical protein